MKSHSALIGVIALAAGLAGCGANSTPTASDARQSNAAQSAPYQPGTGLASSSYDRHPRFYTGGQDAKDGAQPTTQPASAQ